MMLSIRVAGLNHIGHRMVGEVLIGLTMLGEGNGGAHEWKIRRWWVSNWLQKKIMAFWMAGLDHVGHRMVGEVLVGLRIVAERHNGSQDVSGRRWYCRSQDVRRRRPWALEWQDWTLDSGCGVMKHQDGRSRWWWSWLKEKEMVGLKIECKRR